MREFHCLTFHSSREDLKAAAAGALGGAAGGVFVASGAGIVAGALGAGTLTTSGAVGTMSLVGASGGVMGNTVTQVSDQFFHGATAEQSFAMVDLGQQVSSGTIGGLTGAASGGLIAGQQLLNSHANAVNQNLREWMTDFTIHARGAGATDASVRQIQSSIARGMLSSGQASGNAWAGLGVTTHAIGQTGDYFSEAGYASSRRGVGMGSSKPH